MPLTNDYLSEVQERLAGFSASLPPILAEALARYPDLTDADLHLWIEEGMSLAGHSLRSWEAAEDYFRVGPRVLSFVDAASFRAWTSAGKDLAEMSAAIA